MCGTSLNVWNQFNTFCTSLFVVDGDNKYDVLFNVKENRWLYGGAHTTFGGDNNATMVRLSYTLKSKNGVCLLSYETG